MSLTFKIDKNMKTNIDKYFTKEVNETMYCGHYYNGDYNVHPSDKNVHLFMWGGFDKNEVVNTIIQWIFDDNADEGKKGIATRFIEANKDNYKLLKYIQCGLLRLEEIKNNKGE